MIKDIEQFKRFDHDLVDQMFNGTRDQRLTIAEHHPGYFMLYYLSHYFTYKTPNVHFDFFQDCYDLAHNNVKEVAWIAFRESAKSSIAQMGLVLWCICFNKKHYINYDSEDKDNAQSALYDIVIELQTNERILADFGSLYYRRKKKKADTQRGQEQKRIGSFITENGIKVEAFSTYEPTRGRKHRNKRPDLFILDDIENSKTKLSVPITSKVIEHIRELKSGMAPEASILYLGNYITEIGSVATIMRSLKDRDDCRVRFVPVEKNGTIAWPDKYVMTKKEAEKINRENPDSPPKISLEAKKEELNSDGSHTYETEMLNDPGSSGDYYFDRDMVKMALDKARKPIKKVAGLHIWYKYHSRHKYGLGADTAEGVGRDSSASVVINYSLRPARVCARFSNNQISAYDFGEEVARHGREYGECIVVPEINAQGYATVAQLINPDGADYNNVYTRQVKNKKTGMISKEYGFRTTRSTKSDILGNFKAAFEDGEILIEDEQLLNEMYHFEIQHLRQTQAQDGMTQHFDTLIAAALAWEGRYFASPSKEDKRLLFKSPNANKPYEV